MVQLTARTPILAPVTKFLPPPAMDTFLEAANDMLEYGFDYNSAVRAGWEAVKVDWERPPVGKRWVRKFNPNHEPAGSPVGGQFASADGGGGGTSAEAETARPGVGQKIKNWLGKPETKKMIYHALITAAVGAAIEIPAHLLFHGAADAVAHSLLGMGGPGLVTAAGAGIMIEKVANKLGVGPDRAKAYVVGALEKMIGFAKAAEEVISNDEIRAFLKEVLDAVRAYEPPAKGEQKKSEPGSGDVHVDGIMGAVSPPKKKKTDDEESVEKVLGAGATVEDYIDDFVNSDDPRFDEDDKEQRIRRALGAWYGGKAAGPSTLYVRRNVLNGGDIQQWAKEQGFKSSLPAEDMHVTLAYSKQPFDVSKLAPATDEIEVPAGGGRSVEALGDEGATALRFDHPMLQERHQELRQHGASHDFPSYQPHVTITWDRGELDPSTVTPYSGPIRLGPEVFEPIKTEFSPDQIKEDDMATKLLKIVKADDEQRIAYGWASVISIKGKPFEDSQGDIIDAPTLEKATADFMMDVRRAMAMHQRNDDGMIEEGMSKGVVVHSFPLTADIIKALDLHSDMEGWIVGVKVLDDAVWAKVKSGELGSFSIGGRGYRVPA